MIKTAILEDDGDVKFSLGEIEVAFLRSGDDEEAGEALIHLGTSASMGMRMVPVGAGLIENLEGVGVGLSGIDYKTRVPVCCFGDVEAVPMDDGGFGEIVGEVNADDGIFFYADNGSKIGIGEWGESVCWT